MKLLYSYLLIINAAGFLLMLVDKWKAKKNRWRIRESTLLIVAALGESLMGSLAVSHVKGQREHLHSFLL